MKKIGIYSLIFLLVFSMIPMPSIDSVSAESEEEETEDIVLFAEEEGDEIDLYSSEEDVEVDESEFDIPDESEALLIHNDSTFEYEDQLYVFIQYEDEDSEDDTDQLVEGYVDAERVVLAEDVEEYLENRQQGEETESESDDNDFDEAEEAENDESVEEEKENKAESKENDEDENLQEEKSSNNDMDSENKEIEANTKEKSSSPSLFSAHKTSKTSKLVRINNDQVKVYESIQGDAFEAGSKHTRITYYVKNEAEVSGETYYLVSTEPSATKGTIGWVHAGDVKSYAHEGVAKKPKTLDLNGEGNARSNDWGGSKDFIHSDLSDYAGDQLHVNLTEKVGNNTWYRGKINGEGQNVWLHSNFVFKSEESKTSKLVRINNDQVKVYESIQG